MGDVIYGATDRLGYGYCVPCADEMEAEGDDLARYTPDPHERCDRCGRNIIAASRKAKEAANG